MSQPYEFSIATNAEAETLNDKIDAFNGKQVSFYGDVETLIDYVIKDNGNIIAGIRSCFYLGKCLAINVLFVDENHRHKGLGSLLLNKVETKAAALGARLFHLDTFDFQAKDFYLKYGYEIFGILEDCPPGYKRYYMRKYL
ncbi:TPA: GNAT family N-acetyltransferase [Legionella pneumophila]|uniref:N-acetyltransferase domain-containing protein n=1 Tax=Legionella fallonii LLAP-10 TaxID=1212491 RepID=A0A098G9U5_9GAMM|nr:GNAT family N-acetyltransferase [Legionella fallonii]HAU3668125.1 GNAT family N-acetyltransferase [Legionella pneumophila]CEG58260.1 conserved protein of unknown function [Legionella fallonii LLAP-10]HCJ1109623.1 GNAT family N-acetyltransferase [Legionella pneumophila]HCJ1112897.1 GNAT family N-acetyltransferase [Legionella pneumophila]HCU6011382.1 GNAT family N-acetyltransferase [Legionella pneumophila]